MTKKLIICSEPLEALDADGVSLGELSDGTTTATAACRLQPIIAEVSGRKPLIEVGLLGLVGKDARGDMVLKACEARGISTRFIGRKQDKKTAAYTRVDKMQLPYIERDDSAFRYLYEDAHCDPVEAFLKEADAQTIFLVTGIGASRSLTDQGFDRLVSTVRRAKEKGAMIVVDPEFRMRLWRDPAQAREVLSRLFGEAETVFFSFPDDLGPPEHPVFDWKTPDEVRDGLWAMGVKNAIVRMGEKGMHVHERGGRAWQVPVEPHFDVPVAGTAGAGCTCMAGTLMALLHGLPLRQASVIGVRAGTQNVQHEETILRPELVPTAETLRHDLANAPVQALHASRAKAGVRAITTANSPRFP